MTVLTVARCFFISPPATRVWDLSDGSKRNFFTNRNPPHTRLTALNLVNEDDVPLLLTGSGTIAPSAAWPAHPRHVLTHVVACVLL